MKRLVALMMCAVSLGAAAQNQPWEFPWNPDVDNDELIGVEDLMSLLSVYGAEFVLEVPENESHTLALQPAGHMKYWECESYCYGIGGHVATWVELNLFPDSLLIPHSGEEIQIGGSTSSYGCGARYGRRIHVNYRHQRQYWSWMTLSPDNPFYYVYEVETNVQWPNNGPYCSWEYSGDLDLQTRSSNVFNIYEEAGCICAGRIVNE